MMRFGPILAAFGLCLAVTACGDNSKAVMNKEDMLAASGFKFVPANTPARQEAFRRLPPHKFVREVKGDRVLYVYADPTICVCIYVGGQKAYGTYQARRLDKRIADQQAAVAADMYMTNWDWTMWADGYPMGWPYVDSIYNY
jgi:hypothetical protein